MAPPRTASGHAAERLRVRHLNAKRREEQDCFAAFSSFQMCFGIAPLRFSFFLLLPSSTSSPFVSVVLFRPFRY